MEKRAVKTTLTYANCELSAREKIKMKDISDSRPISELQTGDIITVDVWALVQIHNENLEEPDYQNLIIKTPQGEKYHTSSNSFFLSLDNIQSELDNAGDIGAFDIRIIKKQSKNNSGQFLTCALV